MMMKRNDDKRNDQDQDDQDNDKDDKGNDDKGKGNKISGMGLVGREGPRPAKMQCRGGAAGNFALRPTPAKRRGPRRWAVRPPGTAWNAGGRR